MARRKDAKTRFAEAVGELGLSKAVELLEFMSLVQKQTEFPYAVEKAKKPGRVTGRKAIEEELKRRESKQVEDSVSGRISKT